MPVANNAFPTAGRFRYVAGDRTDRPWITLRANRGVRSLGTSSRLTIDARRPFVGATPFVRVHQHIASRQLVVQRMKARLGFSLPRIDWQVGPHITLFEACSAFTHVAACILAKSPSDPLHRGLQPLRYLHDCYMDASRLPRSFCVCWDR